MREGQKLDSYIKVSQTQMAKQNYKTKNTI